MWTISSDVLLSVTEDPIIISSVAWQKIEGLKYSSALFPYLNKATFYHDHQ